MQDLNDIIRTGGSARNKNLGDRLVLLVLEEINRRAQFAAQRGKQCHHDGCHFVGQPYFDSFGFGITDAQCLRHTVGQPVPANRHDAAEHQFTVEENTDRGVLKAYVNERSHFFAKHLRPCRFKSIGRADERGNDLFRRQPGTFRGGLQVVDQLFFGAADERPAFLPGLGSLRLGARAGRNDEAVKHVVRQVLLEIIFGIEP